MRVIDQRGGVTLENTSPSRSSTGPLPHHCVIALQGWNNRSQRAMIASTSAGDITTRTWRCATEDDVDDDDAWYEYDFNDRHWDFATQIILQPDSTPPRGIKTTAVWIWHGGSFDGTVFCRKRLYTGVLKGR